MVARAASAAGGLLALAVAVAGCGGDVGAPGGSDAPGHAQARIRVLQSVGERVLLPTLRDFASQAQALQEATQALADGTESGSADAERADAREAFRQAMASWQRAELLQVGPAGAPDMVMGGEGLRDEIYSWPTASACSVDQELVAASHEQADFFEQTRVNGYGLDALEYVLFVESADNACPVTLAINAEGQWDALSADEIRARRASYAAVVACGVAQRARELRDAWEPNRGNFLGELTLAEGAQLYGTAQEALDALFAAMFYLDLRVKDRKLAEPAGIASTCAATTCPQDRESRWANLSREHIADNLRALRAVYRGSLEADDADAYAFDALLGEVGAGELRDELAVAMDGAVDAVDAIDGPLAEALEDDLASVEAAHAAVKEVTDLLKSQFVTVLGLRVPQEGAGDND